MVVGQIDGTMFQAFVNRTLFLKDNETKVRHLDSTGQDLALVGSLAADTNLGHLAILGEQGLEVCLLAVVGQIPDEELL